MKNWQFSGMKHGLYNSFLIFFFQLFQMMHVVPAANPVNSEGLLQHQPENNQLTACLSPEYSAPSSPFDFDIDFLINDAVGTVGQQQLQQPKQLTPASPVHHQDNSDADSGINLEGSGSQHW